MSPNGKMNVHCVVILTCFQLTKITVYGVVLPVIPEEWRKNPKEIPFNYHKIVDNTRYNNKFIYPSVSNIKIPIISIPQAKTQITDPKFSTFTFPKKEYQHFNTPQLITQIGKPYTLMPLTQLQNDKSLDFPDSNDDNQIYFDETKYHENKTEHNKPNDGKDKLKKVEMLNTSKNINNNISLKPDKVEKKILNNDCKSRVLKDRTIFNTRSPKKEKSNQTLIEKNQTKLQNNKTIQRYENNKTNKESNEIKNTIFTANKENPSDKDKNINKSQDDFLERKPYIEIIINHNNNDPPTYIIIRSQGHPETDRTAHYKVPDWNYGNKRQTATVCLTEGSHQDNGEFVTNQYTNSILDTDNYANAYQIESDTKEDSGNVFPINEASSYNAENVNMNIYNISSM